MGIVATIPPERDKTPGGFINQGEIELWHPAPMLAMTFLLTI